MKESKENAYSTKFKELIELKKFIGKELGITDWMEMNQQKINDFAKITDDNQWIHTDPKKSALSKKFSIVSYKKVLSENLKVMDSSAISLARDNSLPMVVFSILENNAFKNAVQGKGSYTVITED